MPDLEDVWQKALLRIRESGEDPEVLITKAAANLLKYGK